MSEAVARILSASPTVSFQDAGRHGFRKLGIAPAGALDRFAAAQANRLLRNDPDATTLEIGPGGLTISVLRSTWLALAGCASSDSLPPSTARLVREGETLSFAGSSEGTWAYLAAPGGWITSRPFGSASFHARSSVGSEVTTGTELTCASTLHLPAIRRRAISPCDRRDYTSPPVLRLHRGPHYSEFSAGDIASLTSASWKISSKSDRSGYRLTGSRLNGSGTLPSIPTLVGSIQVPPSGEPIVTLHDGPTVGGYPVVALLDPDDLSWFVQRPPHSSVSFAWHESTPSKL